MGVHQGSGLVLQAVRRIYIRAAVLIVSTCRITKANLAGWQHPLHYSHSPSVWTKKSDGGGTSGVYGSY